MKPRQRLVKPEIHSDPDLWKSEQSTGLPLFRAFVGLWNFADREGRFPWKAEQLRALILPYWTGDFDLCLEELRKRRFIVRYRHGKSVYGVVRTFRKHQSVNNRETPSHLPEPPEGYEDSDPDEDLTPLERAPDACPTRHNLDQDAASCIGSGTASGSGSGAGTGEVAPGGALPPSGESWTAELQSRVFTSAFSESQQTFPSMGGRHVGGFHAKVVSTAQLQGVTPRELFTTALKRWLSKALTEAERRAPYACFEASWGDLTSKGEKAPPAPAQGRFPARASPRSLGTTGKDFEDAEDIETQIARWSK
jgi:hypothetical protein